MNLSIDYSKIKRILITRTDRIGDVVLSTPVFRAIKQKYPGSYLAALVFKETAPILEGNPSVDEVLIYDKKGKHRSWWRTFLYGLDLGKKKFDVVVHLHSTNRVNIISWLAKIPVRIGYKRKNHFLLTHILEEKKREGKRHEADYNFDLLEMINVAPPSELQLYFPLHEKDLNHLKVAHPELNQHRYVVFHPSASSISKIWSPERMAEVADEIFKRYGVFSVIVGEGGGKRHAAEMKSRMRQKAIDLSGKLSLEMLGWLMKGARLVISNDSGPVHIACAVGTPVISIFGRNQAGLSPIRWKPLGKNSSFLQKDVGCVKCLADDCEIDFKCLKELTAADVMLEVEKYGSYLF